MIAIKLNGKKVEIPKEVVTVTCLLDHLSLSERMVIVEHNRIVLAGEHHDNAQVRAGDEIEIVHFVGGG
ncbi:sulfur carrier protein ThiS [Mechercharimyces sp. CAU 1602]|uniref:sulfur carrier protein ThiS n=1 Tax=Mechercharimyces sp. CAU 1602 TaxID=2973933 RepID=UPI0021619D55|nr:sulfur carrier protein ThiS [Mechercharimyces sp. CAU 1602]MCS1350506.1 sulfur carrier protein ThiS [Mechercharimyces sp. CAU 1602]